MRLGAIVGDRYEILEHAGGGGMGTVWRARDREAHRDVAIKVMTRCSPADHERFAREVETLAALDDPGIVRFVDAGTGEDGQPWLATEWLEGSDLSHRLEDGPLSPADTIELGARVARSLANAHARGVIHRDVKPSNLFLVGGDVRAVKVLDFGVARRHGETSQLTTTGTTVGTPSYMAPEQARGDRDIDARVDIFSLGCVLYECVSGYVAFPGKNIVAVLAKLLLEEVPRLSERVPGVAPSLVEVVQACLSKDPALRPFDALAVAEELELVRRELNAGVSEPMRPRAPKLRALGDGEQRVVTVVLARPEAQLDEALETRALSTRVARVGRLAERHRARVEELANGSVAALVSGDSSATDLAARAARLARDLRDTFGQSRIAIATGRAMLGAALPVGEAIDAAASVLKRARGDGIIALDETSAALLDRRFEIGAGEGGPVLLGEREAGAAPRLLGRATRFVGRARELATLEAVIDEAMSERVARAALVLGESGMGKTRLERELLLRLDAHVPAPTVWLARCTEDAVSAHGLLARIVRAAAAIRAGEAPDRQLRKLRSRVRRRLSGEDAERVARFLAEAIGAPVSPGDPHLDAARTDPRTMGDQIRRAFEDLIDAECAAAPLVVVIDDLQWADPPSVAAIDRVLRNLEDRPLVVLGLGRPEVREALGDPWSTRGLTQVTLDALPRRAAIELVRDAIEGIDDEKAADLAARSGGNALWLEELVRATASGLSGDAPPSIIALAQARLSTLPAPERRVLRAASIFGERFWEEGLERLLGEGRTAQQLDVHLDALERAELIERRARSRFPSAREWSFRHAVVRNAAYSMLTDEDRRLGHRLAGEWLETAGEQDPARLAEHFERGGAAEHAALFFQRAAERALEGEDLAGAMARAERGIAAGAKGEVLGALRLVQAQAHAWRAENAEARRWAESALDALGPTDERWYRALEVMMTASLAVGSNDALARAEALLDERVKGRAWARATARLAVSAFQLGDEERAARSIANVEAIDEEITRAPDVAAALHRARASRAAQGGDDAECLLCLQAAARAQDEAGAQRRACIERMNAAVLETRLGLFEEAEAHLAAALDDAVRIGLPLVVEPARLNLGRVRALLGRFDEAAAEIGAVIDALRERGDRRTMGAARTYLAEAQLAAHQLEAAEGEARLGAELLVGVIPVRPYGLAVLSDVLLARERTDEALEVAREARRALDEAGGGEMGDALVRIVLADALAAAGHADEASAAYQDAYTRLISRADRIAHPAWRASFLARVPEHARTVRAFERTLESARRA